jgi:hypothetical protein
VLEAAVHGVIAPASPQLLQGASVTLAGGEPALAITQAVDRDGGFLLPHLTPGSYVLTVKLGKRPAVQAETFTVEPGETVEIRATVDAAQTLRLNIHSAGPAQPEPLPDEDGDGLLSARGLTAMQNETEVDGASATQSYSAVPVGTGRDPSPDPDGDSDSAERNAGPSNGLARGRHAGVAYVFSQAAVREFHVTGQSYSAQAGHAGDVATTVTRSGTRNLHGTGFFVLRSQAFAAHSPLAIATSYTNGMVTSAEVKPHDLRENFGVALGGPLPHTRTLFFFYTLDQQLRGFPAISSPANAQFYHLTATQSSLLQNRGVPTSAVNVALNYISSLTGSTPRRADQTLNFARLDWRPRERLAFAVEYNSVRWTSPAGLVDAPVVARGRASLGNVGGSLDLLQLRATQRVSPHTIFETRAAYVADVQYETPQTPLPQEPAISPGGLSPEVNIAPNGLLFGTPASLAQQAYPDERRVQLAQTVTLVRGRHSIDLGGEWSWVRDHVATLANSAGTFNYDSGGTSGYAGGLVDFITDYTFNPNVSPTEACPSIVAVTRFFCFHSFSQSFGEQAVTFSTQNWAAYAEDTWRPRRGLTLHAGARYEYTLLPSPSAPNSALDAIFGTQASTAVLPEDRNNLGPRVSLAWEPLGAGRGTLHAGYGVYFGRLPGATIQSALSDTALPGSTTRIRFPHTIEASCPQNPAQGFGYPCAFLSPPGGILATTTSAMVFDRHFRLPMVQQGSLSLERELRRGTRVTLGYIVNLDRQLPGSRDLNIAPATGVRQFQLRGGTGRPGVLDGETFRLPFYTSRISPSFGPVTDIVSDVNATYHALTLSAASRPRHDLNARVDYTWSRAIDFGQNQSATPRTNGQLDPFTHGYDKGLSSLDYPWALRALAAWTPALHTAPTWLLRAANGWDFAPIVAAHSGRPYSLDLSGGTLLAGGHESLNGSGGSLYLPTVGRNTLRLPATVNFDLRASRGFQASHRIRLQAAAETFNLFNHRNVSSVNQRAYLVGTAIGGITPLVFQSAAAIAAEGLNTQPFGALTSASTSLARERQLQFSLRLEF